jgi:hypothetical protein
MLYPGWFPTLSWKQTRPHPHLEAVLLLLLALVDDLEVGKLAGVNGVLVCLNPDPTPTTKRSKTLAQADYVIKTHLEGVLLLLLVLVDDLEVGTPPTPL